MTHRKNVFDNRRVLHNFPQRPHKKFTPLATANLLKKSDLPNLSPLFTAPTSTTIILYKKREICVSPYQKFITTVKIWKFI
jgi:hypothetical protein